MPESSLHEVSPVAERSERTTPRRRAARRRGARSRDGRVTFEDRTRRGPNGKRVKYRVWGYTLGSKSMRQRFFREDWTEQDAYDELAKTRTARTAGRLTTRRDRTFAVVAAEYLDAKRRTQKRSVKEDERILLRRFGPAFGLECRLRAITREMIAQYRERRLAQVAINTVRNELSVLRHLLRCALEVGDLDTVPGIKLPSPPEDQVRYLEPDEIERLLAACQASRNRMLWHVVALALNTGMRQDEILGLEWTRVNLSTGVIALRRTASASQKGRKPRSLPMNDAVYQILVALQPEPSLRVGRLFRPGRRGSQIRTAWNTALQRAGIADFTFHGLRHTAASYLVMNGATLQEVQQILGHSDLRMTLRYAHLSPAHLRGAVGRVRFGVPEPAAEPPPPAAVVESFPAHRRH